MLWVSHALARSNEEPVHSAELDAMIVQQAKLHGVPERLVRRVVMRESRYNPQARNRRYWGLMQISYPTAKSMGFKGSPEELLNPLVNLTYAVPYLANAFIVAGKREDAAVRLYASGYYDTARRRGLVGALRTAGSDPSAEDQTASIATPSQSSGFFGSSFATDTPPAAAPVVAPAQPPVPDSAKGENAGDDVAMVANKKGAFEPPKKWRRDGGVTVISRGEQSITRVAADDHQGDAEPQKPRKAARGRSRKNTEFATLEASPANAQAYAAVAPEPNARIDQTASQSAISQATSPPLQAAVPQEVTATQQGAAEATAAATPGTSQAADQQKAPDKENHGKRPHARGRHSHAPVEEGVKAVAKADNAKAE